MTNKEKYRQYCKSHPPALYQNDWWLDAVCGENWDAVFSENGAAFAFPYKKKYGLKLITMPMLTLGLGPAGKPGGIEDLLPHFDLFDLYFLTDLTGFKGFKELTRHSYRITDLSDTGKVFKEFASSTRQQIRKAEKNVTVSESDDIGLLYKMVSHTFGRQSKKAPYSLDYVKRIDAACQAHRCKKILVAKDSGGNVHGACFLAWDKNTAYYVMGGSDPKYRSSAAYSLLMWQAIQEAAKHSQQFDFCGSSIPSIAKFFSGFGAVKISYLHLKKINSKALALLLRLKKK